MKKETVKARKSFKIEKSGKFFVITTIKGRKPLAKVRSYRGAYNARARLLKAS